MFIFKNNKNSSGVAPPKNIQEIGHEKVNKSTASKSKMASLKQKKAHTTVTEFDAVEQSNEIQKLQMAHEARPIKTKLATIAAAPVSIFATSYGMMQKSIENGISDTIGLGLALATSLAAGTILTTATIQVFNITLDATKRQATKVAGLAGSLTVPIICISTNFAVIGTSGQPSLVYDMEQSAQAWEEYTSYSLNDAEKSYSAIATLIPTRDRICGMAENELEHGTVSGSAGRGALSASMQSLCIDATSIIETLEETALRTEQNRTEALEVASKLSDIPKDETIGDVFERQDVFRRETKRLKEVVGQSVTENVEKRLNAQLTKMESSLAPMNIRQGEFGNVQREGITALEGSISVMIDTTKNLLRDDAGKSAAPQPEKLLDMQQAVIVHWFRNIPQILLALMLDLMPLWFCAMLMVSRSIPFARAEEICDAKQNNNAKEE